MQVTRRTFLSSSFAAGIVAAAEATRSCWLLRNDTPIRIGIADFGENGAEQARLFSAIPGTEVAGLLRNQKRMIHMSLSHIREYRKPTPLIYGSVQHMLNDPTLDMISLSGQQSATASLLGLIAVAKTPMLSDLPLEIPLKEQDRVMRTLIASKAPVHFRMDYFDGESMTQDVQNWVARSSVGETTATLTVPVCARKNQISRAGALSLAAIFGACGLTPDDLLQRIHVGGRDISTSKGIAFGKVPIPGHSYGIRSLQIQPCGGDPEMSILSLSHARGSVRVPISKQPNLQATLRSTMRFLNRVRFPSDSDNLDSIRACTASFLMQSFHNSVAA